MRCSWCWSFKIANHLVKLFIGSFLTMQLVPNWSSLFLVNKDHHCSVLISSALPQIRINKTQRTLDYFEYPWNFGRSLAKIGKHRRRLRRLDEKSAIEKQGANSNHHSNHDDSFGNEDEFKSHIPSRLDEPLYSYDEFDISRESNLNEFNQELATSYDENENLLKQHESNNKNLIHGQSLDTGRKNGHWKLHLAAIILSIVSVITMFALIVFVFVKRPDDVQAFKERCLNPNKPDHREADKVKGTHVKVKGKKKEGVMAVRGGGMGCVQRNGEMGGDVLEEQKQVEENYESGDKDNFGSNIILRSGPVLNRSGNLPYQASPASPARY